ncbi:hypothetical protein ACFQO7_28130 [Catellatospora aurea]|uniref:Ribbon-helix-helix CopG family protein n=1 Tax=Catellatospora aurea TaxID=1337874 RepID=A0ABW2H708_9ACTN
MKRMSVTVTDGVADTVQELGTESVLRKALEIWYAQRGQTPDLSSEGARLRAMLDVADATLRDICLEIGYEHMATWHNGEAAAERATHRARRARSVEEWTAEESAQAGGRR